MMNWNKFESELTEYFKNLKAKSYNDTAKKIATLYHDTVIKAEDVFGNTPILIFAKKQELQSNLTLGFSQAKNIKYGTANNILEYTIKNAIAIYWKSITFNITKLPPNNIPISNVAVHKQDIRIKWPKISQRVDVLSKELRRAFQEHLKTIEGRFTMTNNSGITIVVPWTGLK